MSSQAEYKPCAGCGVKGYTDERTFSNDHNGYLCIRCKRPDMDWSKAKTRMVDES